MRRTIFACAAAVLFCAPISADDSSAALGAGGLVFTNDTPIRMAAEDLYISPKQVRVRFVFANDTGSDVKTLVAFPLPDIDTGEFWGSAIGTLTDDPVNFVGFKALVDDRPVSFQIEQRAFVKGRDVTAVIVSTGLPVNPVAGSGYQALDKLSPALRQRLIAAGTAVDDGSGNIIPQWTVETKFYWPVVFPAHKTVTIEHSYEPVTGQSFFGGEQASDKDAVGTYCIDDPTRARIVAISNALLQAKAPNGGYLNAYETDYILKTANNWRGPIGRFHLVLDKLGPDNVLTLCWAGPLQRTSATTFESVLVNFAPVRDIRLLVLESPTP
jgi:hypothetical protein